MIINKNKVDIFKKSIEVLNDQELLSLINSTDSINEESILLAKREHRIRTFLSLEAEDSKENNIGKTNNSKAPIPNFLKCHSDYDLETDSNYISKMKVLIVVIVSITLTYAMFFWPQEGYVDYNNEDTGTNPNIEENIGYLYKLDGSSFSEFYNSINYDFNINSNYSSGSIIIDNNPNKYEFLDYLNTSISDGTIEENHSAHNPRSSIISYQD